MKSSTKVYKVQSGNVVTIFGDKQKAEEFAKSKNLVVIEQDLLQGQSAVIFESDYLTSLDTEVS